MISPKKSDYMNFVSQLLLTLNVFCMNLLMLMQKLISSWFSVQPP